MRRIAVFGLLVLPVAALLVGWRIWARAPALVVSLRALPEVAKVEYTGTLNEATELLCPTNVAGTRKGIRARLHRRTTGSGAGPPLGTYILKQGCRPRHPQPLIRQEKLRCQLFPTGVRSTTSPAMRDTKAMPCYFSLGAF
jgi:hypothetical protein